MGFSVPQLRLRPEQEWGHLETIRNRAAFLNISLVSARVLQTQRPLQSFVAFDKISFEARVFVGAKLNTSC
jgi:hypothetical protein